MDIFFAGLRDRRVAAADEHMDGSRQLFGRGGHGRRRRPGLHGFDIRRVQYDRLPVDITTIVLHCTAGNTFLESRRLPPSYEDRDITSTHRVDDIIAHFIVLNNGNVIYTHDVQFTLNDAGGRKGIDIEFAGRFSSSRKPPNGASRRLSLEAIRAGRTLVATLKRKMPNLAYIHPHGQVQRENRNGRTPKHCTCPGPDIWVNVGEWAVSSLSLECENPSSYYPNNGICTRQTNPLYDQSQTISDLREAEDRDFNSVINSILRDY